MMVKLSVPSSDDDLTQVLARPIFLKIGTAVFMFGVAWAMLSAQVKDKVDMPVFVRHITNEDSLKVEIIHALEGVRSEVRDVKAQNEQFRHYICRQRPGDFGC